MVLPAEVEPFIESLKRRLEQGAIQYGDVSFSRDPQELIEELKQECLDLAGWGFILWVRLSEMERAIS